MEQVFQKKIKVKKEELFHEVSPLCFINDIMFVNIDGKDCSFLLKDISQRLFSASKQQREIYRIDSYGYGIHWPLIDEDLSIDGLLGIKHEYPDYFYRSVPQKILAVRERKKRYVATTKQKTK